MARDTSAGGEGRITRSVSKRRPTELLEYEPPKRQRQRRGAASAADKDAPRQGASDGQMPAAGPSAAAGPNVAHDPNGRSSDESLSPAPETTRLARQGKAPATHESTPTPGADPGRDDRRSGSSPWPDYSPTPAPGGVGAESSSAARHREERFIQGPNDSSFKFDRNSQPFGRKTWTYNYVAVVNTGENQTTKKFELMKRLARLGSRTSQLDKRPYFQPDTDLSLVSDDVGPGVDISRPGSPLREPQHIESAAHPTYFLVPLNCEEEVAPYSQKLKVRDQDLREFTAKEHMTNLLFVFKVDRPDVDLSRFGMYPVVDVRTGIVYHPMNSKRAGMVDYGRTPQSLHQLAKDSERERQRGHGR